MKNLLTLILTAALFFGSTAFGQEEEFVPLSPSLSDQLAQPLAEKFHRPVDEVRAVIDYVEANTSQEAFPGPLDVLAVVAVESRFKNAATGLPRACKGLMQINGSVHHGINLFDPAANLQKGIEILTQYRTLVSSDDAALVAWNAGPGKVNRLCGKKKTCRNGYVTKINHQRDFLLALLNHTTL